MKKNIKLLLAGLILMCAPILCACQDDEPPMQTDQPPVQSDETPGTGEEPPAQDEEPPVQGDETGEVKPSLPPEPLSAEIRPIFTEGKRWVLRRYSTWSDTSGGTFRFSLKIEKNGTHEGHTVWARSIGDEEWPNPMLWGGSYYEDNGMIYRLGNYSIPGTPNAQNSWIRAFEVCSDGVAGYTNINIQSTGTIVLGGKTLRAVRIIAVRMFCYKSYVDYWVEGIGPLRDSEYRNVDMKCPGAPYLVELLECYDGDEKIYDVKEFSHDLYTEIETFFPWDEKILNDDVNQWRWSGE